MIVEHDFLGEIVSYLVNLGQGEDFKLTTELSEKVQCPHNQAIKSVLNEAILLISHMSNTLDQIPVDKTWIPTESSRKMKPEVQ